MTFSACGGIRPLTFAVCSPRGWCHGMSRALDGVPENAEAKGLSVSRGWIGAEEKSRLLGVTYHCRARDPGMVLNVCPWCGAPIRFDTTGVAR